MTVRARITGDLRDSGDIEAGAALLVADGKVYAAASERDAFAQWLALTEWLAANTQPSKSWQALHVALAHGRVAVAADARAQALPDFTDASTVLAVVKETLGPDAYAKVRQAIVDRMLGKQP